VKLSVLAFAGGPVLQAHIMGQDVDGAALYRGDAIGKDEDLAIGVVAEEGQLGVEAQGLGIVQINVSYRNISWRSRCCNGPW
jgi:hypothetical protein